MPSFNQSRSEIGFVGAARRAFNFLRDLGFEEVGAEDTIVRFASSLVLVNAYHGRSSYELGIEVLLIGMDPPGYALPELIALTAPEKAASFRTPTAVTLDQVERFIQEIADQLQSYGHAALRGDKVAFSALHQQRRERARDYAAEVRYSQVRPRAEEAFRQQRYSEAARLYESVRAMLNQVELKKLEFAKKHS